MNAPKRSGANKKTLEKIIVLMLEHIKNVTDSNRYPLDPESPLGKVELAIIAAGYKPHKRKEMP